MINVSVSKSFLMHTIAQKEEAPAGTRLKWQVGNPGCFSYTKGELPIPYAIPGILKDLSQTFILYIRMAIRMVDPVAFTQ